MNTIALMVLVGVFNAHFTYSQMNVPRDYIRSTYRMDKTDTPNKPNCLVALNREFKGRGTLQTKESCSEVQEKLRASYEGL